MRCTSVKSTTLSAVITRSISRFVIPGMRLRCFRALWIEGMSQCALRKSAMLVMTRARSGPNNRGAFRSSSVSFASNASRTRTRSDAVPPIICTYSYNSNGFNHCIRRTNPISSMTAARLMNAIQLLNRWCFRGRCFFNSAMLCVCAFVLCIVTMSVALWCSGLCMRRSGVSS